MMRRNVLSEGAEEEVRRAKGTFATSGNDRAEEFLSQVRVTNRFLQEFPFSKSIHTRADDLEVRRAKVGRFSFWLFYFVYPSVDLQTGEPLDIIYILGCRHEKQAEPIQAELMNGHPHLERIEHALLKAALQRFWGDKSSLVQTS